MALLLSLAIQDLLDRKCDLKVVDLADWCRTCEKPAGAGHDGHAVGKSHVCVRKYWTNG